jgi:hypothetical protein
VGKQRNKTKIARFLTTFKFDIRSKRDFPSSPDKLPIKGVANAVNSAAASRIADRIYRTTNLHKQLRTTPWQACNSDVIPHIVDGGSRMG